MKESGNRVFAFPSRKMPWMEFFEVLLSSPGPLVDPHASGSGYSERFPGQLAPGHPIKVIKQLISGGQTGADSSIVEVGKKLGIPTGGVVPKGWKTEQGARPELGSFGFIESDSTDYAVRTRQNVARSDATLLFATNPDSDGTRLTIEHAKHIGKPFLLVDPFRPGAVERVRKWLLATRPEVLNVAGNRESKAPGISLQAEKVLLSCLRPPPVD